MVGREFSLIKEILAVIAIVNVANRGKKENQDKETTKDHIDTARVIDSRNNDQEGDNKGEERKKNRDDSQSGALFCDRLFCKLWL